MTTMRSTFLVFTACMATAPAFADSFAFSTGNVTNQIAVASRPDGSGRSEREAADDFVLGRTTSLTGASFTGLIVGASDATLPAIDSVVVEIYRLFPADSNTARTPRVPTRTNSPSDVALDSRDSGVAGQLSFTTTLLQTSFTASNSVLNGINASPNQTTGGDGPVSGREFEFSITFAQPFVLPADHYFFVPQVSLSNGEFYWLSATRPIVAPGSPFTPDLQSWIRSASLDPDWLRIGTDIAGAGSFNQAFTLTGTVEAVPEPESWALMFGGLAGLFLATGRSSNRRARR